MMTWAKWVQGIPFVIHMETAIRPLHHWSTNERLETWLMRVVDDDHTVEVNAPTFERICRQLGFGRDSKPYRERWVSIACAMPRQPLNPNPDVLDISSTYTYQVVTVICPREAWDEWHRWVNQPIPLGRERP